MNKIDKEQIRKAKEKWDKKKDRKQWHNNYVRSIHSIVERAEQKKQEQAK